MNKYIGSNFDDFLAEEGTFAEIEAVAIKRVVAYQITQFMEKNRLSKSAMARQMDTSRSALDRLLDPKKHGNHPSHFGASCSGNRQTSAHRIFLIQHIREYHLRRIAIENQDLLNSPLQKIKSLKKFYFGMTRTRELSILPSNSLQETKRLLRWYMISVSTIS